MNFIRLLEPRDAAITEEVLYQTVVNQVELMKANRIPGTFLLQYDALIDPRYQELLKGLPRDQFEIGAWWELPQPLVEKAGLEWRGRFPWDWHAHVGFVSGYTPEEREKLADVYMADFKEAYGYYPKSVACWFVDAHTLDYLHRNYGIVASAICKDQIGTDGYTLWGGYWNQAYYPSKQNAYMPAQTESGQIPVPIFRMLGSDPIRQYVGGIGGEYQSVVTLEPVYHDSGGDPNWVNWFFHNFVEGECLTFNYAQAGQENSFTWRSMRQGLQHQFPLIAKLRDEQKIRLETLAESGEWFQRNHKTTPPTAMAYLTPLGEDARQAVWFNSRFYRTHMALEEGKLWIRDIHLFDQSVKSTIFDRKIDSSAVSLHTLPVVDGFNWSSTSQHASLRVKTRVLGEVVEMEGEGLAVTEPADGTLRVAWPLKTVPGQLVVTLTEGSLDFALENSPECHWWIELETADDAKLPFTDVSPQTLTAHFQGATYRIAAERGAFTPDGAGFRMQPEQDRLTLKMDLRSE